MGSHQIDACAKSGRRADGTIGIEMKEPSPAIAARRISGGWVDGTISVFRFQAKVYDAGSRFGLNGGRVSKLAVWLEAGGFRGTVMNYDRGWDVGPKSGPEREILRALLAYLEALPIPSPRERMEKG